MKAVIMAGGEGTRLRPLTSNLPKPMMPLANKPMMEHVIDLLRRHGFDEIVVTLAFMPDAIRNHFGDGSEYGVHIQYATEESPLGTAGSVRNAADALDERFLVISGDVLTDIDLGKVVAFHEEKGALATIGLVPVENPLEFGIVITNEDGSIERFLEKPSWGQVFSDTINTGIFVLEPEIFDHIAVDRPVDFSSEVFPALLDAGLPLYGAVADGYWEDVGTLEAYVSAHKDILDQKVVVDVPGFEISGGVWVGEGAEVHPDAVIDGPAVIGDNARVEAGARLGEYAVLGTNVKVRADAQIRRSIVQDNAYLGEGVRLAGAVVGRACDVRRGARCEDGSVLGDECFIGEDAVIGAGVKVYPFKTVEAAAVVNTSIVWESRGARSLFSGSGVSGLANVDITPEFAARLAMAFGTTLKKDTTVVTSRDSSRSARMLKRSMMAGLNSAGVNVSDLEVASIPVTRFQATRPDNRGAITLRLAPHDPQQIEIRFFDENGADLDDDGRRKVERYFNRQDFRRVLPSEIGDIDFPPRALEAYAVALEACVDVRVVRAAQFKIVLDYGYGTTAFVMPNLLSKLGTEVLAVNPYVATAGILDFDRVQHAEQVAGLVRTSGAVLGAVIDPGGEHLTLIDDTGRVLDDTDALLTLLALLGEDLAGHEVALPVATTLHAEELVTRHGGRVLATKLADASVMEAAREPEVVFAAGLSGGYVIPEFVAAYDASATLVRTLELLAKRNVRLSDLVAALPDRHLVRDAVITPWEQKGTVMRTLMERSGDRELVLVDGVKMRHDDGWVLALPDPDEPVTNVWAEADTDLAARQLAEEYVRRIRQMIR
jgi:mannose-1-phosphate guanylyltransferase / phosphomannomutase